MKKKVFIVTDLEGVSGCVAGGYGYKLPPETKAAYERLMMGEINAAVEGCVKAGAGEIIVGEAHPIDLETLRPEAKLARGIYWEDAPGLADFDAVIFVGQHARANVQKAARTHTGSSRSITRFWINGREAGELAYIGGLFGEKGVPVVFLSGDKAACEEAAEWADGITTVAVEEALHAWGALCLSPAKTRPMITEGVENALRRARKVAPIKFALPATIKIEFTYPQIADSFCVTPGAKRLDARTASFTGGTYHEAYMGGVASLRNVLHRYDSHE